METISSYLTTVYIPSKLDLKTSSAQQLRVAVSLLDKWAGRSVTLSELSPELTTAFLRHLGESSRSPRTVNGRRASIITIWQHAARKGLAPKFEPEEIPKRKLHRRQPTAWDAAEMRQIIDCIESDCLKTFVRFLYEGGPRLSSACRLKWSDWNRDLMMMRLPAETAKTGVEQFIRVTSKTAWHIEQLRTHGQSRIFPFPEDLRPIWRQLRAALIKAGLPCTRRDLFQKIRRTTATMTASASSVETASRQLGHTSTRQTLSAYIDPTKLSVIHASDVIPRM